MIEGLTSLTTPGVPNGARMIGSKFALPAGFDSTKFSSRWAEEGNEVLEAQQDEYIESANVKAVGWQVYKQTKPKYKITMEEDKDTGEMVEEAKQTGVETNPVVRVVGKRSFVLMFRPRALQTAVNGLYAKISRDMVNQELKGETARANESGDPAILTNADLRRAGKLTGEEDVSQIPEPLAWTENRPEDSLVAQLG